MYINMNYIKLYKNQLNKINYKCNYSYMGHYQHLTY